MKQAFGVLALVLGVVLLGALIADLVGGPENGGARLEPLRPLAFILVLFTFGIAWVRGKSPVAPNPPVPAPPPLEVPAPPTGGEGKRASDLEKILRAASVEKTTAPRLNKLDRMRQFDLNKLNWVGWLLLAGSFAVAVAAGIATGFAVEQQKDRLGERGLVLIALPVLGLCIGPFFGCRWLLRQVGVSIYRPEQGEPAEGNGP